MVPVYNKSQIPHVFVANGGAFVFPPEGSRQYWTVRENPAVAVGQSPYEPVATDHPRPASVTSPLVRVPPDVANALNAHIAKFKGDLILGAAAEKLAGVAIESLRDARKRAEEELAKVRAELAEDKRKLELRIAAEEKAKKG